MKTPTFWLGGVEVGPDGRPANAPTPTTQDSADVQDLLTANADLKADLDKVTKELDALKASAGAALPEDAHARLVAIKGVGEKLADEILAALQD